eukprot:Rhum_TRINITY_DN15504_c2_g2::Rhum_TRINITY_DN15504_c2_g2_i1::g.160746::m.160746
MERVTPLRGRLCRFAHRLNAVLLLAFIKKGVDVRLHTLVPERYLFSLSSQLVAPFCSLLRSLQDSLLVILLHRLQLVARWTVPDPRRDWVIALLAHLCLRLLEAFCSQLFFCLLHTILLPSVCNVRPANSLPCHRRQAVLPLAFSVSLNFPPCSLCDGLLVLLFQRLQLAVARSSVLQVSAEAVRARHELHVPLGAGDLHGDGALVRTVDGVLPPVAAERAGVPARQPTTAGQHAPAVGRLLLEVLGLAQRPQRVVLALHRQPVVHVPAAPQPLLQPLPHVALGGERLQVPEQHQRPLRTREQDVHALLAAHPPGHPSLVRPHHRRHDHVRLLSLQVVDCCHAHARGLRDDRGVLVRT